MPVLMNKGTDPRQAAWLFYTDRATLDAFGAAAAGQRFDAGVLTVDDADLDAAAKPSSEVPVYLAVATLVPEDFDLAQLAGGAADAGSPQEASPEADAENGGATGVPADGGATGPAGESPAESPAAAASPEADADSPKAALPYEPVPAPEGTRVRIGTTTLAAAQAFIRPREVDGKPWAAELPGLPMLVALIDHLRDHGGLPQCAVWHVDPQGILRMAPAKQVKPMAGNVLKCKR